MNKLYLLTIGFAIAAGFAAVNYGLSADLRAVQSGELTLVCVMKDGERVIDGSKVTGLINGKWTFVNGGYAWNCKTSKAGDL